MVKCAGIVVHFDCGTGSCQIEGTELLMRPCTSYIFIHTSNSLKATMVAPGVGFPNPKVLLVGSSPSANKESVLRASSMQVMTYS